MDDEALARSARGRTHPRGPERLQRQQPLTALPASLRRFSDLARLFNTTGLDAMDYRITTFTQVGGPARCLSQRAVDPAPRQQWCFQPAAESPVAPPPSEIGPDHVRGFSNPAKIGAGSSSSEPAARASPVEAARDRQRALRYQGFQSRASFIMNRQRAPARTRVEAVPQYLAMHGRTDLMLDVSFTAEPPMPRAGWACRRLAGRRHGDFARRGSLLHAVGLDELVAQSPDQYIDIACGWRRMPAPSRRARRPA